MAKVENFDDLDKNVLDIDEVVGTDIKINPDFYIHNALVKAQEALTKDNLKEGFVQFRFLVEHIEVLCRAANMLSDDYDRDLSDFKQSDEYNKEEKDYAKNVKIANKKIQLLMKEVFSNKVATDPLKM